jgi:hypothetical protein
MTVGLVVGKMERSNGNRCSDTEAGDRLVGEMTQTDVYSLRDVMKETPVSANHMLSVLRTLIEWGVPRGYRADNPVIGVSKISTESSGAMPWSEEGYAYIIAHTPTDLARVTFLTTGQRANDLGPVHK